MFWPTGAANSVPDSTAGVGCVRAGEGVATTALGPPTRQVAPSPVRARHGPAWAALPAVRDTRRDNTRLVFKQSCLRGELLAPVRGQALVLVPIRRQAQPLAVRPLHGRHGRYAGAAPITAALRDRGPTSGEHTASAK